MILEELKRRRAKRPVSEYAKTPFGRYSGKFALSSILVCSWCGAPYRRCTASRKTYTKHVWRCSAHHDRAKNCPKSEGIEEITLQNTILRAIRDAFLPKESLEEMTWSALAKAITEGEDEGLQEIRRRIADLEKTRRELVAKCLEENDIAKYELMLKTTKKELESLKAQLEQEQSTSPATTARMEEIMEVLSSQEDGSLQWDDVIIRKAIRRITVRPKGKLEIQFQDDRTVEVEVSTLWQGHSGTFCRSTRYPT